MSAFKENAFLDILLTCLFMSNIENFWKTGMGVLQNRVAEK